MKGIILSVIIVFSISNAFACNCEELKITKAYNNSDLIFTGKLINKEIKVTEVEAPKIKSIQKYTRIIFTFEVIEVIKGRKHNSIVKISSKFNDINFMLGEEYLIYSYFSEYLLTSNFYINGEKVKPFLATDFCTNTKKLSFVNKKELKKLRKIARRQKNAV